MKIYTNLTGFMSGEGISYSDRVVLQVMLDVIKKGYQVIPFICEKGKYNQINDKIFAEYFFSKNIISKNRYKLETVLDFEEICEEDVYLEADILTEENVEWEKYYLKFENANCRMYSYLFWESVIKNDESENQLPRWIQMQCKYMDKIIVENADMKRSIQDMAPYCKAMLEIQGLKYFIDSNHVDKLLEIDKGFRQIIQKNEYVVHLLDCTDVKSNRMCMEEIRKRYPDKKIVIYLSSGKEVKKIKNFLYKDSELGKNLFIAQGIDYYTLLNLYASAFMVIVPRGCKDCRFEIEHIKNLKGKYIFL